MITSNRFSFFILLIATIILGIVSRNIVGIPTFFGDSLYAVMAYFGVRMFFIHLNHKRVAIVALAYCFCIEFLQRYRAEWIVAIQRTALGHYVLGQGFLWSDLAYYCLGITIAFCIDFHLVKRK